MQDIFKKFPITEQEYILLDKKYGNLTEYAAWELIKNNSRNNHTDDQQDIAQELKIALLVAGSYYKRQVYIETCLSLCEKYVKDRFQKAVVRALRRLWNNKTRHGANRQKFGPYQEKMLERLLRRWVPNKERPNKKARLRIDSKFNTYCKAITWNRQKSVGKKITREKSIRHGQVSLSEYDYLGTI